MISPLDYYWFHSTANEIPVAHRHAWRKVGTLTGGTIGGNKIPPRRSLRFRRNRFRRTGVNLRLRPACYSLANTGPRRIHDPLTHIDRHEVHGHFAGHLIRSRLTEDARNLAVEKMGIVHRLMLALGEPAIRDGKLVFGTTVADGNDAVVDEIPKMFGGGGLGLIGAMAFGTPLKNVTDTMDAILWPCLWVAASERKRLLGDQQGAADCSAAERKAGLGKMADGFDQQVGGLVGAMSSASTANANRPYLS